MIELAKYSFKHKLGSAEMTEVWLATVRGLRGFEKEVVLKTMLPAHSQNTELVERFAREAALAARLSHPGIVQIYDFGAVGGIFYIEMEYVSGCTFRQLVTEPKRRFDRQSVPSLLHLVADCCDSVQYLHDFHDDDGSRLGLLHRDLSLENVMVTLTGYSKLLDFGAVRIEPDSTQRDVDSLGAMASQVLDCVREIDPALAVSFEPHRSCATAAELANELRSRLHVQGVHLDRAELSRLVAAEFAERRMTPTSEIQLPPTVSRDPSHAGQFDLFGAYSAVRTRTIRARKREKSVFDRPVRPVEPTSARGEEGPAKAPPPKEQARPRRFHFPGHDEPNLAKYQIIEKLGEGGTASVWLAIRESSDRPCVVKVLHQRFTDDAVARGRFLREAQVAALLDHPNVARLYDAGVSSEVSYLAMEFIPGPDVDSVIHKLWQERKMPPAPLSIAITLQLLDGLHYAHDLEDSDGTHLQIVHRDLSPRNVMITFGGEVKIIDFGLVRTTLGEFRTAPGMIAGTLRYMSPEQASGEPLDRRSDIYTWAVVLHELLTGHPLISRNEGGAVLASVMLEVPPLLSELNPNLPRGLDAVVAKALAKKRDERFATAAEFRDAIALAAGPLGLASKESIGDFLTSLFPEQRSKTLAFLTLPIRHPRGTSTTRVVPVQIQDRRVVRKNLFLGIGLGIFSLVLVVLALLLGS